MYGGGGVGHIKVGNWMHVVGCVEAEEVHLCTGPLTEMAGPLKSSNYWSPLPTTKKTPMVCN